MVIGRHSEHRRGSRNFRQWGGGGGSKFPKILTIKFKKNEEEIKRKKAEGCSCSFTFADVYMV